MNNKEVINSNNVRNQNFESKRMNSSNKLKKKKDESLPWWVELFFVQIGLPDNLLIKILKGKKKFNEFLKNEKKNIFIFLFIITALGYFYPVVKQAKNKLNCEALAKNYILDKKIKKSFNQRELKMLSTNFCNGGDEIFKIKN